MKKILKNCDSLSREFHLTYKGKNKLQTEFGGLLAIVAMIIILLNGFLIGKDIFFKENPLVLRFEKNLDNSPSTRINYKNMFFGFSLSNGPVFQDDSILTVIPYYEIHYYNKNGTMKHKIMSLELTDCSSEFLKHNLTPPFISSYFSIIQCIKSLDLILSGTWKENPVIYLTFQVRTCKNDSLSYDQNMLDEEEKEELSNIIKNFTLSNQIGLNSFTKDSVEVGNKKFKELLYSNIKKSKPKIQCKSQEEINKKINSLYFNFYFNKISFNSKNFLSPINSQGETDWIKLGTSFYKELIIDFSHYVLSTDNGLIFDELSKEEIGIGYNRHSIDISNKNEDSDILMNASIYISDNVKYLNRGYIKVQNIFANMGGIMKFVLFIFQMLYFPFFNKKLNLKFVNKIFEFDDHHHIEEYKKEMKDVSILKNLIETKKSNDLSNNNQNQEKWNEIQNDKSDSGRQNLNNIDKKSLNKENSILNIDHIIPKLSRKVEIRKNNDRSLNVDNIEFKSNDEIGVNAKILIENKLKEKKLNYQNLDILKYLYCKCIYRNGLLKRKNQLLNWASKNLFDYTDFLNTIKIHRDLTKLKYFIFNNSQLKSFEFINNPKKYENDIFHHNNEFAEAFQIGKNKSENFQEVVKYFKEQRKCNKLDNIDEKLLQVIDPEIKRFIFDEKEN